MPSRLLGGMQQTIRCHYGRKYDIKLSTVHQCKQCKHGCLPPGRVFTADHPSYMAENLYNKIKSDIPLQDSFCVLPSGEFSMWLGNKFSYEGELTVELVWK